MSTITLGSFIKLLESVDSEKFVPHSLNGLHSFRGEPAHLAIYNCNGSTVKEMLQEAKEAVGKTFSGYKGGEYVMTENTEIHFAHYGSIDEYPEQLSFFINSIFS